MKDVILKTITVDKDLKYEDISKNARIYYQKKTKNLPLFQQKQPDAFINSMTDDATYRFLIGLKNDAGTIADGFERRDETFRERN